MADINDPTVNVNLWNDAKTKSVTVTTDGAKERLDCNMDGSEVIISDSEAATRYQLKSDYDVSGIALNTSTDTQLYTFSGEGVIDLVAVNSPTSSNWEITVKIDGTERLRITMANLGSALGLTNSDFDVVAETANKQFRYRPRSIGFTSSFTILAKATTGTPSVNYMILFRERT